MADDMPSPPLVYEGLDPNPESKSTIAEVSDAVRGAANRVGDAIEKGKKPGMPLSVLSNIALSVSEPLSQVLRWAYWWNSTEESPDDVTSEQVT